MFMSLIRGVVALAEPTAAIFWTPIAPLRDQHPAGQISDSDAVGTLGFVLSEHALTGGGVVACHACDMPKGAALLRVDEVCFPIGAVAHRHSHARAVALQTQGVPSFCARWLFPRSNRAHRHLLWSTLPMLNCRVCR